jgi:hypothetical protein
VPSSRVSRNQLGPFTKSFIYTASGEAHIPERDKSTIRSPRLNETLPSSPLTIGCTVPVRVQTHFTPRYHQLLFLVRVRFAAVRNSQCPWFPPRCAGTIPSLLASLSSHIFIFSVQPSSSLCINKLVFWALLHHPFEFYLLGPIQHSFRTCRRKCLVSL